jgi:sulfite dehydrogenase
MGECVVRGRRRQEPEQFPAHAARNQRRDHIDQSTQIPRRHFLIAAGSAGAAVAMPVSLGSSAALAQDAKPLPAYVSWKNPEAMIVHSSSTLETKRNFFGTSGVTP